MKHFKFFKIAAVHRLGFKKNSKFQVLIGFRVDHRVIVPNLVEII